MRDIAARRRLAHADVNHIRVGLADAYAADRTCAEESIRNGQPIHTAVNTLPQTSTRRAQVIDKRLRRNARHSRHAPASVRADAAPLQRLEKALVITLRLLLRAKRPPRDEGNKAE